MTKKYTTNATKPAPCNFRDKGRGNLIDRLAAETLQKSKETLEQNLVAAR
jgi:hypothetical protein